MPTKVHSIFEAGTAAPASPQGTANVVALSRDAAVSVDPAESARLAAGELGRLLAAPTAHYSALILASPHSPANSPAQPELMAAIISILESPAEVAPHIVLTDETIRETRMLAGTLVDQISERWNDNVRLLAPHELVEIEELFQLRLEAVARLCPSFISDLDGHVSFTSFISTRINASPYRTTNPKESALTYLWGFLVQYARWGETGYGEELLEKRAEKPRLFPLVMDGVEVPDFFVSDTPGALETAGGIDVSLWWKEEQKCVRLLRVGYIWTPRGYLIEKVQGDARLGKKQIFLPGGKKQNLFNYAEAKLQGDLRGRFTAYVVEELRRQQPERPIFYRRGSQMNSIPIEVYGVHPPKEYQAARPMPGLWEAVRYLPPDQLPGMIQKATENLERRLADPIEDKWVRTHYPKQLAQLKRVLLIWKGLDDIALGLGFEEVPTHVSLWRLPAGKPLGVVPVRLERMHHQQTTALGQRQRQFAAKADGRIAAIVDAPETLAVLGEELVVPMKYMIVELPDGKIDFRVGNSPLDRREHDDPYRYEIVEKDPEGAELSKITGAISLTRESFFPSPHIDFRTGWEHKEFLLADDEKVVAAGYLVRAGKQFFIDGGSRDFATGPRAVQSDRAALKPGLARARGLVEGIIHEKVRVAHQIGLARGQVKVHLVRRDHSGRHDGSSPEMRRGAVSGSSVLPFGALSVVSEASLSEAMVI